MPDQMEEKQGRAVIESLAEIYQQLYIAPGEDKETVYKEVVLQGKEPPSKDLSHFHTDERDILVYEHTPAGEVCLITLHDREDFETFFRIMGNRCKPVPIRKTQGAIILDGLINWVKIRKHKEEWLSARASEGNFFADWSSEFQKFTAERENFKDVLIALSTGPYSNVPAAEFGLTDEKWLHDSQLIRKTHECTHFVCRRLFRDQIDTIWDEVVADAIGIYATYGKPDPQMEERFLGIRDGRYVGGRLENYVPEQDGKDEVLQDLSGQISRMLRELEKMILSHTGSDPYELVIEIEKHKEDFPLR